MGCEGGCDGGCNPGSGDGKPLEQVEPIPSGTY
jgi:hypothetical protein